MPAIWLYSLTMSKKGVPRIHKLLRSWLKPPFLLLPLETTVTQLFTAAELTAASLAEVNAQIGTALTYDEYDWQDEHRIAITYEKRAEGIEKVLYQCYLCGEEFAMHSEGAELYCEHCGTRWQMSEYGNMIPRHCDGQTLPASAG
jgi:DNA-directed RNA polymerase subunit RPC12/RpoP